jgi:hypothetical protein
LSLIGIDRFVACFTCLEEALPPDSASQRR